MVKTNQAQSEGLNEMREFVLEVMSSMEIWTEKQLRQLSEIKLGVLRKNATQRHGVTRWKKGITQPKCPSEVEVIDLHPRLLEKDWRPYGAWVMHHEFVHALGFLAHDNMFRRLENLWPSKKSKEMGIKFTEFLRRQRATWILKCNDCNREFPRTKPGKGRYSCRDCKTILVDINIKSVL